MIVLDTSTVIDFIKGDLRLKGIIEDAEKKGGSNRIICGIFVRAPHPTEA